MRYLWPLALVALAGCGSTEEATVSTDAEAAKKRGDELAAQGDLRGAVAEFDRAIEADAKYAAAWNNRGLAKLRLKNADAALKDFEQAATLSPGDARVLCNRGWAYEARGDSLKAIADLDAALKLNPKFRVAYYRRGIVRSHRGDLEGAHLDFQEAVKLPPQDPEMLTALAEVRIKLKQYDGAIEACTTALKVDADHVAALNVRGMAWHWKGDAAKAVADYTAALKAKPGDSEILFNRSVTLCADNKFAEAIADLDLVVAASPNWAAAWKQRGYVKFQMGKGDDALPDYRKALEVAPKDWPDRKEIEEWLKKDKEEKH